VRQGFDLSLGVLHANTLGSCAEEDRCCTEGVMGKSEGGEEDGTPGWRDAVSEEWNRD
jgi:hypothetical protein